MSDSTAGTGVGFLGLLTILFIALKLMHYINWSWWWVLAPTWMPISAFICGAIIVVIGSLI